MNTWNDPSIFEQAEYAVRFEWGEEGARRLAPLSSITVVVDVLSFTTCVNVAVERGARVYPYRYRDESAAAFAESVGAILVGKRGSGPSLSPVSLATLEPRSRVVLPSPNGAVCCSVAAEAGTTVVAGCLRNAAAVAAYVERQRGPVSVIACGERWESGVFRPSFEDLVGAGAILSQLSSRRLSPEAEAAVGAFRRVEADLEAALRQCVSGRELIARGFLGDVLLASELNASAVVPVLNDGAFGELQP